MKDLTYMLVNNYETIMYVLAADVALGGILGFVIGKSRASLIAGVISGILLALAGYLLAKGNIWGVYLGLVVSLALVVVFFRRYAQTRKPFPGLVMGVTCVLAAVVNIIVLLNFS